MDKKILAEYVSMKAEIKDLQKRIAADRKKITDLQGTIVTDSVTCGKRGKKPIRTIKITGFPKAEIEHRKNLLERRVAKIEMLQTDLEELTNQVEEFIQGIEKSEVRLIFRFYYIDGMTWVLVAEKMNRIFPKRHIAFTEESCRKRHDRYLDQY